MYRNFQSSQREEGDGQSGVGHSATFEASQVDKAQLNDLVSYYKAALYMLFYATSNAFGI